jgi:hypothetical protein
MASTVDGAAEAPSASGIPSACWHAPRPHQPCATKRVHRAPGPAHPRLLAAGAGPCLCAAGGHLGQRARHHAHEGRPGLHGGAGGAGHHADDTAQIVGICWARCSGRPLRKALRGRCACSRTCCGLLMLTYAVHRSCCGAFAVLHGVAWGLRGPFMQAMRADYFGRNAIGMIMGLSAVIVAMGQIAGPDGGRHAGRPDGQLPPGLHAAGAGRGVGFGAVPDGEEAGPGAAT